MFFPGVTLSEAKTPAEAILFSKEELKKLPMLKYGRHRITRDGLHQIRYRRDGFDKQFTAKDLKTVKEKFREWVLTENERMKNAQPVRRVRTFGEYALAYFEEVKKVNVEAKTYENQLSTVKRHILPTLGSLSLREIKASDCQKLLNGILAQGKGRTADGVKVILKEILRRAVGEKLLADNPMSYVKIPKHVKKNGVALSQREVVEFVNALETSYYRRIFLFMLYTGIRRGELKSAVFDGDFVTVACGKCRKGERQRYRKIPIADGLRPLLPLSERELRAYDKALTRAFKELCPAHHLHDLRHTFTTRAQECNIPKNVVDVWTGHVNRSDMTSAVYTHFSDEYMRAEMKKFHFDGLTTQNTTQKK